MMDSIISEPILRFYGVLILGLLALGGLVLGGLYLLGKRPHSVWLTYKGWLIMTPIVLIGFGLGRIATLILLFLVAIASVKEFARATGLYRDWWMTSAIYLGLALVSVVTFVPDPGTGENGWYGMFMAMPVFAVCMILFIPIAQNRHKGQLQAISLAILGFIYFGWLFGHLGFLTNSKHAMSYLFFLVFAVQINDISAFMFGKLLGKHPLADKISPNKTVEGSLGALAVSFAMPWVFQSVLPSLTTGQLWLTGLILGFGSQFGDLTISLIKRDIGVKDMGATIPGHGGILDRIDSLIFVAPLFFHMVRWFEVF